MDEIATESGSDAVGVIFFGANGHNKLNVSDVFESVLRNFVFVDKKYGVRAVNTSAHNLC